MNLNLHSTGASFVAAKTENNPRDLVAKVIRSRPDATRKELFQDFRQLLDEYGDEYKSAVDWYFFVNMHDYMTTNRSRPNPAQRAQEAKKKRVMIDAIKSQIVALELIMPNGKQMGDCTGAEMQNFGGAFNAIGKKVGPKGFVGKTLTEQQVRRLLKIL